MLAVKTYGGIDYEPYLETLAFYKRRSFGLYEVIVDYKPFGDQPAAILIKCLDCRSPGKDASQFNSNLLLAILNLACCIIIR